MGKKFLFGIGVILIISGLIYFVSERSKTNEAEQDARQQQFVEEVEAAPKEEPQAAQDVVAETCVSPEQEAGETVGEQWLGVLPPYLYLACHADLTADLKIQKSKDGLYWSDRAPDWVYNHYCPHGAG